MVKIKILMTGGTFDKEYDEINGSLYFKETHLPEMLDLGRCKRALETETLMLIDSLDMTDDHRQTIANKCQEAKEDHLVITHGTDTMVETAQVIADRKLDKTVVITGAMIPYKFGSSDGLFNLGSAIAYAEVLAPGVYIAMNGEYFPWDNVRKDRQAGLFKALNES